VECKSGGILREREIRPLGRRKALKGEAQECWELKEASEDLRDGESRREGSQTLGTGLLKRKATFSDAFPKGRVNKKGP
jgi:hypothetical protein